MKTPLPCLLTINGGSCAPLNSSHAGRAKVRVIRTDEEPMIARAVSLALKLGDITP